MRALSRRIYRAGPRTGCHACDAHELSRRDAARYGLGQEVSSPPPSTGATPMLTAKQDDDDEIKKVN